VERETFCTEQILLSPQQGSSRGQSQDFEENQQWVGGTSGSWWFKGGKGITGEGKFQEVKAWEYDDVGDGGSKVGKKKKHAGGGI